MFRKLFFIFSRRYFNAKFENCLCSRWLRRHATFSLAREVFIFLNYCYWVYKHTQVSFLSDCSFKICEKPLRFFRKCPRSHCRVRVVNDYADMVSTAMLARCPRSQCNFWKFPNNFFVLLLLLVFSFFKVNKKLFTVCPHSRWLRWHMSA